MDLLHYFEPVDFELFQTEKKFTKHLCNVSDVVLQLDHRVEEATVSLFGSSLGRPTTKCIAGDFRPLREAALTSDSLKRLLSP